MLLSGNTFFYNVMQFTIFKEKIIKDKSDNKRTKKEYNIKNMN